MEKKPIEGELESLVSFNHWSRKKWMLPIINLLIKEGPKSYTELRAGLPTINNNGLDLALKELLYFKMIESKFEHIGDPHQKYFILPLGASLEPVIAAIILWEETNCKT